MPRILVFDNEADSRNLVRRVLERSGHHVEVFATPEAMVLAVYASEPDLAVLRVRVGSRGVEEMPLRLRGIRPGLPLVVISDRPWNGPACLTDRELLFEPLEIEAIEDHVKALLGCDHRAKNWTDDA